MANELGFRPQHRLLRTAEYTAVFGVRRVLRGSLLNLHYGPGATGSARLGLVIPKRNAAHAVTRNYCKRAARELFRHRRADLPALDLVLRLAQPVKASGRAFRESYGAMLREDFEKLLGRLPR